MSDFFDDSHVTDVGLRGSVGPTVGFWDMVEQGFRQQYRVDSALALDEELRTRWLESLQGLRTAGQNFNAPAEPLMYRGFARFVREGTPVTMPTVEGSGYGARINYDVQQPHVEFEEMRRANDAIRQLNNPDIKTFEQILEEVSEMQRGVEEQTASMSERAPGSFFAELIGAIGGSFTPRDPLNVITAPIGAGRTIATRIATDMAVAAGVVTTTEFGDVAPNRALAGLPERNPLFNIAAATLGAGVIRGGIEGVGYGVRRFRDRPAAEEIDFDLRDSQLQQMFASADTPTMRAGAQALDDVTFIERNNPYGEGQAAQARFLAELQEVQRVMGGEPMTAIARVLPPMPFEYIQKAADFEIVREQAPLVYARMEEAQARLQHTESDQPELSVRDNPEFANLTNREIAEKLAERTLDGTTRFRKPNSDGTAIVTPDMSNKRPGRFRITYFKGSEPTHHVNTTSLDEAIYRGLESGFEPTFKLGRNINDGKSARREANKEYKAAYRAVEAEAVRLHEAQARVEVAQQREAVHIFADATYGRPFNWSALQHNNVQARIDAINAFNDTLDKKAVAAFVRQVEGEGEEAVAREAAEKGKLEEFNRDGNDRFLLYKAPDGQEAYIHLQVSDDGTAEISVDPFSKDPNRFGASAIRDAARQLSEMYPEIRTLYGLRQSGAGPGRMQRVDLSALIGYETSEGRVAWLTEDGRVDIGLREPVDPNFRVTTDDGDISIAEAMRDLQDDADLDKAMRSCLR